MALEDVVTVLKNIVASVNSLASAVAGAESAPTFVSTTVYTVAQSDVTLIFNGSALCTLTLPAPTETIGRQLWVTSRMAFAVTSASSNVVPVAGGAAGTAILAATIGKWALLQSDGVLWQIVSAN